MAKLDEDDLRLQEYHNKRVVFFGSWVKAWIQNRMELDKQLFSLSALAIGLLTKSTFLLFLFGATLTLVLAISQSGFIIMKAT